MVQLSDHVLKQTVTTVKTLSLCAIAGAEAGFVIGGTEGAKIGALAGLTLGVGLLIYFSQQQREEETAYPFLS